MVNVGTSHMDPLCVGMLFECLFVQRHVLNMPKHITSANSKWKCQIYAYGVSAGGGVYLSYSRFVWKVDFPKECFFCNEMTHMPTNFL